MLLASGLAACGAGSSLDEYEDGVPSVVPSPVTTTEGTVGESCANNNACEGDGTECLTAVPILTANLMFPGGYCTQNCEKSEDCPTGSGCYTTAKSCLKICTDSAQCRMAEGYSCAAPPLAGTSSPKYCLPASVAGLIGGAGGTTGGFLAGLGGLLGGGGTPGGSTSGGGTTGGFLAGLGGLLGGGGTPGGSMSGSAAGGGTTGGFLAGLGGLLGGGGTPGGTGN